jgi:WD40 repeat protein
MQGFKGHEKQISQILFLRDNKHLASVSHDSTARIWNIYEHSQFDKEMVIFEGKYPLLSIE